MHYLKYLIFPLMLLFQACPTAEERPDTSTKNEETTMNKTTPKVPLPTFTNDDLIGKINPKTDPRFVKIASKYTPKTNIYLRKEAYEAFELMYEAALQEGIRLSIISATRPFHHQKSIWEAKWTGTRKVGGKNLSKAIPFGKNRALEILKYSSMPGTSRHHWGTDIDLNSLENSWFEQGEGLKIYNWLVDNAMVYGYCQVYTPKGDDRPHGYEEEKWHWSYLPTAQLMSRQFERELNDTDINGFEGANVAPDIGVVEKYVLGINLECK